MAGAFLIYVDLCGLVFQLSFDEVAVQTSDVAD